MISVSKILEAKDLTLYKRLLSVLGEYSILVPCTGVSKMFDLAVKGGIKVMPKDEMAHDILRYVLYSVEAKSVAGIVHKFLNMRFSDLPVEHRPMIKVSKRHEVAFWARGKVLSDRVKDLINFDDTNDVGYWSDVDGNKQELIDLKSQDTPVAVEEK
jgi:hypothetical protein